MRVLGVDEAGRGPILGPMAVAVVAVDDAGAQALSEAGVADSKSFGVGPEAREQRADLVALIHRHVLGAELTLVSVDEIDRHTYQGQLNALERKVVRELLRKLAATREDRIICDGAKLFDRLRRQYPALEAVDRAESVHVSVAAASVLAKHARDQAFAEIAARYEPEFGPIRGGGYINAATKRFLAAYRGRYGGLPPEARKSWGVDKYEANGVLFS